MYNLDMSSMTATEARASLPELLDRVATGEEITITRHGRPVAVLVRPDILRVRRAGAAWERATEVRARLEEARRSPDTPTHGLSTDRAEELVAEVRAARRSR